jgi:hypothetical protein
VEDAISFVGDEVLSEDVDEGDHEDAAREDNLLRVEGEGFQYYS